MKQYILGIDVGTSQMKVALFDLDGRAVASATPAYPVYQPQNGWAEQDAEDWWNAAVTGIREVLHGIDAASVAAVGLGGQMHGLVMLDEAGAPVRRSILWCDQRTADECRQITETVGAERLLTLTANPALTGFTASKILWVRNHEPENYKKCAHILLPKDYVRYRLTGEFATDVSDASGMQLLDVANRCWSEEMLKALDIDCALLAKVYESPEVTGMVTEDAARLTGLCAGTPVVAGAGDNAAAAVGTGCIRDGKSFTTIGTSGVVYAHTSRMAADPAGRIHTFCCAVPGQWHVMGVTQAAGLSLSWLRQNICPELSYREMDALAEQTPIGAEKLIYLPYLMGERTPHLDADARGVFFGLSGMHTRAHLIRAVLEGVSYSLKDCQRIIEGVIGPIGETTVCGGGAASGLWRQMIADVYGCKVQTLRANEGVALGAAILAGVGAGIYQSVAAGCDRIVEVKEEILPVAENTEKYRKVYAFYDSLYDTMKASYQSLSKMEL